MIHLAVSRLTHNKTEFTNQVTHMECLIPSDIISG